MERTITENSFYYAKFELHLSIVLAPSYHVSAIKELQLNWKEDHAARAAGILVQFFKAGTHEGACS